MSNLPARARRVGSVAHRRVAPVLGVAWYTEAQWARVKAQAADAERFEASFGAWVAMAEQALADLRRAGTVPRKCEIDAGELLAWCLAHGKENDAAARAQFVSERMHAEREASIERGG